MPSKTRSQQRLFQAAAHGATFKKAADLRQSMTQSQLKDFATGPLAKLSAPTKKTPRTGRG